MKKYTPLDGLRWSRNSDSALNNMPQTDVLGRAGGEEVQSLYPCANAAWPHLLVFKLWLVFPCIF